MLIGVMFAVVSISYAHAFSVRLDNLKLDNGYSLYQQVFLGVLSGKREVKKTRTMAENVVDLKIVDRDSFYKYTKEIHRIPFDDPTLSFKIRIPDSWEELKLTLGKKLELSSDLPSTLAHYIGPPISELRPHLKVQAMKLKREITAENWLRYFILINGYSILDNKVVATNDKMATVNFIYVNEDITYLGYLKAIIHGDIVSIIRVDIPQKFAKLYGVIQHESINSFRLVFPQSGNIESRKKLKLGNGALYVSYTTSWVRKNQQHNDMGEKIAFELHNVADETTVFGFIRFEAVKREKNKTLETELARVRQDLKDRFGLYVKAINYSEPSYGPARFDYIREEGYEVGFKKIFNTQDQELIFLAMADVEWYIFVYMLSPLKQNDLYSWAINDRAYRIIRDSLE